MQGPDFDFGEIQVLLVDDDREWARFMAAEMEEAAPSVSVTIAKSGEEALERFDADDPVDCLVVDYRMPEMDGVDVLETVRADHPRLPVIIVTGSGSEAVASDAIGSGVTDYIVKDPMTNQAPELVSRVEGAVETHRLREALAESERRYRTVVEESHDAVAILRDRRLVFWNDRLAVLIGRENGNLAEMPFGEAVHAEDRERFEDALGDLGAGGGDSGARFDAQIARPGGEVRSCEFNCTAITYDGAPATLCSIRDVTERKRRERELARALSLKRTVQDIAVQSKTRPEIETAFCRQLVQEEGRLFAWIGEPTDEGVLEPRAIAGDDGGYLNAVELAAGETASDPSTAAAEAREARFVKDVASGDDEWRSVALEHGVRSVAVLPVVHEGVFYGVLAVYANESGAFDDAERDLLIDLVDTLATSIDRTELRSALTADRVVEITLGLTGEGHHLVPAVAALDRDVSTTVEVLETIPQEEGARQFVVGPPDAGERFREALSDAEQVGSVESIDGDGSVFRLAVDGLTPESAIADHGGVVRETAVTAREAELVVEFVESRDVRAVVGDLEDAFGPVSIRRYHKRKRKRDLASVLDRCGLTNRQATVLKTAYRYGYFEETRENYAEEVAEALDISRPTFHTHLRTAQRKVFETLLEEGFSE